MPERWPSDNTAVAGGQQGLWSDASRVTHMLNVKPCSVHFVSDCCVLQVSMQSSAHGYIFCFYDLQSTSGSLDGPDGLRTIVRRPVRLVDVPQVTQ